MFISAHVFFRGSAFTATRRSLYASAISLSLAVVFAMFSSTFYSSNINSNHALALSSAGQKKREKKTILRRIRTRVFCYHNRRHPVLVVTNLGNLVVEKGCAESFGDPRDVVRVHHVHKLDTQQILKHCTKGRRRVGSIGGERGGQVTHYNP